MHAKRNTKGKHKPKLKVATLFSGIGAFEEALKQLSIPHEIVFACDNGERYLEPTFEQICETTKDLSGEEREAYVADLYSKTGKPNFVKQSYFANYEITEDRWHEDIRFLDGTQYSGQIDILVGGSPCQSFSTYGKKRGLEDTRGTLFYDYARIIKECQPKVFIYENVPGCLTHDHKRTWAVMKEVWESIGYDLHFDVLNAADYNHPQLRKRLFIVGFRKDINGLDYKFPPPIPLTRKSTEYLDPGPIDKKYYLAQKGFEWVTTPEKNLRRSRVNQDVIGCQTANQQDNWIGDFRVEPPLAEHRQDKRIYIGKYNGEDAVARKMTPMECLRLMGFEQFKVVVEDRVAYRQAGNSIVVPVLKAIVNTVLPYI